jgi:salicylate hydroxylase
MKGAQVICLERVGAADHQESGTGLNIGPNGVKALMAHEPEVARQITEQSFPWRSWKVSLTDGTTLFDLPLAQVADNDGWRIRWSELYRILREAAAPTIRYGCSIDFMAPSGLNPAHISIGWSQAAGGEQFLDDVDLLIAADGRYSEMRATLAGPPELRHVGVAISRVLVPDTSAGLIDDYEQWFNGPYRLLGFRVPPDHIYATCAFPIPADQPIPEAMKHPEALRQLYLPAMGELSPSAQWMLDTICAHAGELHWARMQEHDVLYAHPQTNALFIGDAAHGMVPTLGQGATQAVEDAVVAGDIIAREWASGSRDPRRWLELIDAARAKRMAFAMRISLEATDTMLPGAEPVAGSLQQLHIKKVQPDFLSKLRSLYCDVAGGPMPMEGQRRAQASG